MNPYISTTLAAMLVIHAAPSKAESAEPHSFARVSEVSDLELGQLRGRFVAPGVIMNFGVELTTHWQTGDGRDMLAGLNLSVDQNFRPAITITTSSGQQNSWLHSGTGSSGSVSGGVGNVNGVNQSIQIAGDGNAVKNNVRLDFSVGNSAQNPAGGTPVGSAGTVTIDSSGTITTVSVGPGGLLLSMNVPGQGQVTQFIGAGGLQQQAQIGGNFNNVYNSMSIHGQMQASGPLDSFGIGRTFDALKGLR